MITAEAFVIEARTWLGVPFRHQGRSRIGSDCAGFIEVLARSMDALPPEYFARRNYGRSGTEELLEIVEQYCARIEAPEVGALILISWPGHENPSHIALCAGQTMIHCYERGGGVVENGYRAQWLRNTHGLYRLPGIDYSAAA